MLIFRSQALIEMQGLSEGLELAFSRVLIINIILNEEDFMCFWDVGWV